MKVTFKENLYEHSVISEDTPEEIDEVNQIEIKSIKESSESSASAATFKVMPFTSSFLHGPSFNK